MFKNFALVLASFLFSAAFLKIVDMTLFENMATLFGGKYSRTEETTVDQKEIYPYSGGHTQPDYFINPEFMTGDHGFMVDFDLDRPPAKKDGEFRLIVTGGSGAAGWGVNAQQAIMSNVLEKMFQQQAACRSEKRLRIINLAMGGSQSYQNYVALNKWGQNLHPDMILSYSGFNDMNVPWFTGGDGYRDFQVLQAYNRIAHYSKSPTWLKWLGRFLPGMVRESSLGLALRSMDVKREAALAREEYLSRFPPVAKEPNAVVDQLVIPNYVQALQSMKRDFQGIPFVVAYQPYGLAENSTTFQGFLTNENKQVVQFNKEFRMDVAAGVDAYLALYERFMAQTKAQLNGYVNDQWLFLNPHAYVRETLLGYDALGDGIHYGNEVQSKIAQHIAADLFPYICATNE